MLTETGERANRQNEIGEAGGAIEAGKEETCPQGDGGARDRRRTGTCGQGEDDAGTGNADTKSVVERSVILDAETGMTPLFVITSDFPS
jgi:hypothetical protein